jgi:hypothetical protein
VAAVKWCSANCCISARSTIASMKVEKEESSGCHAFGAHGLFRTSRRSTAALPIAPFVPDFADAQSGLRLHPDAAARAVMLATSMETS